MRLLGIILFFSKLDTFEWIKFISYYNFPGNFSFTFNSNRFPILGIGLTIKSFLQFGNSFFSFITGTADILFKAKTLLWFALLCRLRDFVLHSILMDVRKLNK